MIDVAKGLLIGVGAGLTTTLILGMYRWVSRFQDRREQITYIRELIDTEIRRILDATDLSTIIGPIGPITADRLRFVYFRALQSELKVALSTRVTALTYKEVSSLQLVLTNFERGITDLSLIELGIIPLHLAQSLHKQFQDLIWLGLPKKEGS